jgi:endonuclease/exonuclease/phosphatase family metal-dependent hydrolase
VDHNLRVASFNVWNDAGTWNARVPAICEAVRAMNADLVALQEVPEGTADLLSERMGFDHAIYMGYPTGPKDGLAVLCRTALARPEAGWDTAYPGLRECGVRVATRMSGREIRITNVHLDFSDIAERERQVLDLHRWTESSPNCDVDVLCGDFNCAPSSSVHRFLTGEQTLDGLSSGSMAAGTSGAWLDAVAHDIAVRGGTDAPTLDFVGNPRWKDRPSLETPRRVDWILIKTRSPDLGIAITSAGRFATDGIGEPPIVASDHYGVFADLSLHGCHPESRPAD